MPCQKRVALVAPISLITPPDAQNTQTSGTGTISGITQAIKTAAARTGVDFSYLLNKASQESSFDPNAKASTSSATGLFQFTKQTWLQMVKNDGAKYGLGQYADQITEDKNGVMHVNDPTTLKTILALRKDPTVSAEMAGELDKQNFGTLKSDVGGKIGPTELYLAHFLGAGGATDFLNALKTSPKTSAATVLPDAAAANPTVFYNQDGSPRSVSQIYQQFAQKFSHPPQMPGSSTATMLAENAPPSAYKVATATNALSQTSSFIPPVMNSVKPNAPSSLYTAMIMAQMNLKDSPSAHMFGLSSAAHKKASQAGLGSSYLT